MSDLSAQAVVYERPETFSLRQFPIPEIGEEEMLVAVDLCGVDGSELHMFKGELSWFNERAPIIFGDEIIGRVHAIGALARKRRGLEVGDRVTVEARWPAADCPDPAHCQYFLCEQNPTGRGYGMIGINDAPALWGGYATHVFVPREALVYKIPDALSDDTALVACSVLANGMRWTELPEAGPGKTLAVVGPGPQGLACVIAAAQAGAKVIVIGLERDGARLETARHFGAAETHAIKPGETVAASVAAIVEKIGKVDIVIETAGSAPAKELAFSLVRQLGTVVNVSVPKPVAQPIDWLAMLVKEVTILNPMSHAHYVDKSLAFAERLLEKGIDVGTMVSHRFALQDAERAIQVASYTAEGETPIKVVLDPRQ